MEITFWGAAGEVTGSAYHVVSERASILVDCGMFQGSKKHEAMNQPPKQQIVNDLDAVLITHAHLDHIGRLPLLLKRDYKGPIYATEATIELAELILQDSARIQESDTERQNRKNERAGRPLIEPLYTREDVAHILNLFHPVPYDDLVEVAPGIKARWVEAGHLLGSAGIELKIVEEGGTKTAVFSGDVGPKNKPIIRDVELLTQADVVIMESTYGDRDHKSAVESNEEAIDLILRTVEQNGKVLVPSFAIGRTQELLYGLAGAIHSGRLPKFPVFVDSPMANKATEIYRNYSELYDEEAYALMESGQLIRDLSQVTAVKDVKESIALNSMSGPLMIISSSGMCTGGRILHHLRHNLWRPETAVIFVGFQAEGSLGRELVDGAEKVWIFGEPIQVKAEIATINGFSGHAGQTELVQWFDSLAPARPQLILTHGEDKSRTALANLLQQHYGIEAMLPYLEDTITV